MIPGYDFYRKDRTDGRSGGGILVYTRHGVPCHPLPDINKTDKEVLWLLYSRPTMPREVSHILIGAVYHPPKAHNGHMIEYLISFMDNISRQHPHTGIIILDDFNQLPDGQLRSYPMRQQLYSSDPRQWWAKPKRILNFSHHNPLSNLDFHGSPDKLANAINEFFVSVSRHMPKADPSILEDLHDDYNSDFIIDPEEVVNRLASIDIYKAPGPDGLPNWLLRDFAAYLCEPLAAIFNASVREGFIPPIWKSADVTPVPKVRCPRSIETDF